MPRFTCPHLTDGDDFPCPICNPKEYAKLTEDVRIRLEADRAPELQPDAARRERSRLAEERADIARAQKEGRPWKPKPSTTATGELAGRRSERAGRTDTPPA